MPALIRALRPLQWVKNLLLFAALVFSEKTAEFEAVVTEHLAVAVFCALASAGYLFNDLRDIENDRTHPEKKHRPIASGEVSPALATATAVLLFIGGAVGAWFINMGFFAVAMAYLLLTTSYSAFLKKLPLLDVFVIATGFVLRAAAGALSIEVYISPWLLVVTGFGALYLGISKRRAEVMLLEGEAAEHRANLAAYTPKVLDQFASLSGASTIMSYAMYTFHETAKTPWLMITVPWVVAGIMRYEMLAQQGHGGAPEKMLVKDPAFTAIGLMWAATVMVVLALS